MLKIIIGEDNALVAIQLKGIAESLGHIVLGVQHCFKSIAKSIEENLPDLVLLDIRMDSEDAGIRLAKMLNEKQIPFIFISAHGDESTLRSAALTKPLSFILKPFSEAQLKVTLSTLALNIERKVGIIVNGKNIPISLNDIIYIQVDNVYCEIHTSSSGRFLVRSGLKALLKELNYVDIVQIHRSYAINKAHVSMMRESKILLKGGKLIPNSSSYPLELP